MSLETLNKIKSLFEKENLDFKLINHKVIPKDSLGAAKVRGTNYEDAAKALILKINKEEFIQVIICASKKLDTKKLRLEIESKKISFAKPDEVYKLTDCVVGTIPPFGVLWNIKTFIDKDLLDKNEVVFSCGTNTDSILSSPKNIQILNNSKILELSK